MTEKTKRGLGGIFGNATVRAPVAAPVAAKTFVLTCVACGAPRKDGSDARECAFCGGNMVSRPAPEVEE